MSDNLDNKDSNQDMIDALSEAQMKKEEAKEAKKAKKQAKKEAKKQAKKESKNNKAKVGQDIDEAASGDTQEDDSREDDSKKLKKSAKKKKQETKPEDINIVKDLLSLIVYIGIVVLACYLIVTFVGCRSRVDGTSMNPTLNDGDNLWVDKLAYEVGDPERFDVIIFNYDEDTTYVKRIIGLPGETVRIDQNGNIYIKPVGGVEMLLEENYGKDRMLPTTIGRASQPILLGEDEYFVLGDNRNNSQDSRTSAVGNVQREDIVGKALFRIYPLSDLGIIK